jgi:ribonuclease HI
MKLVTEYHKDPNTLCLYSDGSKINKSGFFRVGAAAVAYYLGNEVETGQLGLGGHAEVFDAEMAALSLAASKAATLLRDFPNITHIAIFSDCAAATLAITDPKPNSAQLFALRFHHTLRPILETNANLSVSVSWCPSHCDIPGNDRADELAKEATAFGRQTPFSVSRSNAKRRSKRTCLKLWQQEWKNSPKVGRFAIANRLSPSLNQNHHFTNLQNNREVFGRVIQCRTGHAFTGEFRRDFLPLSPDPTSCPCDNETLESRNHILRECPRYAQHRNILSKASRSLALPVILGSKKGIEALALFIRESGAFTRTGTPTTEALSPKFVNEPYPNEAHEFDPGFAQDDGG